MSVDLVTIVWWSLLYVRSRSVYIDRKESKSYVTGVLKVFL